MAKPYSVTLNVSVAGPLNVRPVVQSLRRQLSGITANVNVKINNQSIQGATNLNRTLSSLNQTLAVTAANATTVSNALQGLSTTFANFQRNSTATGRSLSQTTAAMTRTAQQAKVARTEMEAFGRDSALAIRRFTAFSVATGIVFGFIGKIREAAGEAINFDREMVRLSQVSDQSVKSLSFLRDEITRLAKTWGVSSGEILNVAVTLKQAGLTARETTTALDALAKSSLAPSFNDMAETTEGAIAIMRQFGITADELSDALGSVNAVSAAYAVEAEDIIAAVRRTGGVFAAASKGVSSGKDALNEFMAVFTSVRQTTRESAETIATGLRTIFSRIQRGGTIQFLRQFGVELTDLNGKFVGPYEAVKRLSEGLAGLDPRSTVFAQITEELGGFRQVGKVIPLIQQFAVAEEARQVAMAGAGSLDRDAASAQQALAVQFAKVREEFNALIRDIGDSNSFRAFIKLTLDLASGLIKVADAFQPLIPVLAVLGTIKVASAASQFMGGFFSGIRKGNGAGGVGTAAAMAGSTGAATTAAATRAASQVALTTAVNQNTLATQQNTAALQSQNFSRFGTPFPTGAFSPVPRKFARGGVVPGSGNKDSVPALLKPREFVLRKEAVEAIGVGELNKWNHMWRGGLGKPKPWQDAETVRKLLVAKERDAKLFKTGNYKAPSKQEIEQWQVGYAEGDNAAIAKLDPIYKEVRVAYQDKQRKESIAKSKIGAETTAPKTSPIIGADSPFVGLFLKPSPGTDREMMHTVEDKSIVERINSKLGTNFRSFKYPLYQGYIEAKTAQRFRERGTQLFASNIRKLATAFGAEAGVSDPQLQQIVKKSNLYGVLGGMFEGFVSAFTGSVTGGTNDAFDFTNMNTNPQANEFQKLFGPIPKNARYGDTKVSYKGPQQFNKKVANAAAADPSLIYLGGTLGHRRYSMTTQGQRLRRKKMATGGMADADIPALLMPGEFVFNRDAVNRIGLENLERWNNAKKFHDGGFVHKFAKGGQTPRGPGLSETTEFQPFSLNKLASNVSRLENTVHTMTRTVQQIPGSSAARVFSGGSPPPAAKARVQQAVLRPQQAIVDDNYTDIFQVIRTSAKNVATSLVQLASSAGKFSSTLTTSVKPIQRVAAAAQSIPPVIGPPHTPPTGGAYSISNAMAVGRNVPTGASSSLAGSSAQRLAAAQTLASFPTIPMGASTQIPSWHKAMGGSGKRPRFGRVGAMASGFKNLARPQNAGFGALMAAPLLAEHVIGDKTPTAKAAGAGLTAGMGGAFTGAMIAGPAGAVVGGALAGLDAFTKGLKDAKVAEAMEKLAKSTSGLDAAFSNFMKTGNTQQFNAALDNLSKTFAETRKELGTSANIIGVESTGGQRQFEDRLVQAHGGGVTGTFSAFGSQLKAGYTGDVSGIMKDVDKLNVTQGRQLVDSMGDAGRAARGFAEDRLGKGVSLNKLAQDEDLLSTIGRTGARGQRIAEAEIAAQASGDTKALEQARKSAIIAGRAELETYNESIKRQKAYRDAMIATARTVEVLTEKFTRIQAATSRTVAEFSAMDDNLQNMLDSMTGAPKAGKFVAGPNPFENLQAYSPDEIAKALSQTGGMLGKESKGFEALSGQVEARKRVQDELPKIMESAINEIKRGAGGEFIPPEEGEELGSTVADLIGDRVKNLLPDQPDLAGNVIKSLQEALVSRQGKTEEQLVGETKDYAGTLGIVSDEAIKAVEMLRSGLAERGQAFFGQLDNLSSLMVQKNEAINRAMDIRINNELQIAKVLGKDISVQAAGEASRARVRSLTATAGRPGGTTNVAEIGAALPVLEARANKLRAASMEATMRGAGDEADKFGLDLAKTNATIVRYRSALEHLANDTTTAAAVMGKISDLQAQGQGARSMFESLTTSKPTELAQMSRDLSAFINFQKTGKMGATVEQRQGVANAAKMIAPLLPNDAAREKLNQELYKGQVGSVMEMFKGTGLEEMLKNSQMGEIMDAGLMSEGDKMAGLVEELRKANTVQADAAMQLAIIADRAETDYGGQIVGKLDEFVKLLAQRVNEVFGAQKNTPENRYAAQGRINAGTPLPGDKELAQNLTPVTDNFGKQVNQLGQVTDALSRVHIPSDITMTAQIEPIQVNFAGESILADAVAKEVAAKMEALIDQRIQQYIDPNTGRTKTPGPQGKVRR